MMWSCCRKAEMEAARRREEEEQKRLAEVQRKFEVRFIPLLLALISEV
jgi:hypothetical protein